MSIFIAIDQLIANQASPQAVGQVLADHFAQFEESSFKISKLWQELGRQILHNPNNDLLFRTGLSLAKGLDRGKDAGIGNAYHNKAHFAQVLVNTYVLCKLQNLGKFHDLVLVPHEQMLVALAALGHDVQHDGVGNTVDDHWQRFRLERVASQAVEDILPTQGASGLIAKNVRTLIHGTDGSFAGGKISAREFVRQSYEWRFRHACNRGFEPEKPEDLLQLWELSRNQKLCLLAAILCDADILSSAGLTVNSTIQNNTKLGQELKQDLGPKGWLWFSENIVKGFYSDAGRFFAPNYDAIKAAMEAEAADLSHRTDRASGLCRPAPGSLTAG